VSCPTASEPAYIACPQCHEAGCDYCQQQGRLEITECPRTAFQQADIEVVAMADELQELGLTPISGGTLDQAKWFLSASRFCRGEKAEIQNLKSGD